jgi:cell division protein FtsZ
LFETPAEAAQAEMPTPKTFIPPAPERTTVRTPRMPRIDELPLPAQKEIKAQRGELDDDHPEKRRMSLMQRLASVGLGRRADNTEPPLAPRPAQAMPQFERPQRPAARPDEVSEYARRSAPQGLDTHGRTAPVHGSAEEDQLDIPAFLRRQAK